MIKLNFTIPASENVLTPYYLKMVAIDHKIIFADCPTGIANTQLILVRSGTGTLSIGDNKCSVDAGKMVLLRKESPFEWINFKELTADTVLLSGTQLEALIGDPDELTSGIYPVNNPSFIHSLYDQLYEVASNFTNPNPAGISSCVYSLISLFAQEVSLDGGASQQGRYEKLKPMFEYIEKHYQESITLSELATEIDVTPQYLCNVFKKTMNTRIFEYINSYRINISKQLMVENSESTIRDIATQVGLVDLSYFSLIFKRQEGITPRDFRSLLLKKSI